MLPFLAFGALLGVYPGYKVYEHVWKDSSFCFNCHVHDYAHVSWTQSSHKELTTCHDCHHQPLKAYMLDAYHYFIHGAKFPRDLDHVPHVPKDICEACHLTNPKDTSTITGPLSMDEIKKLPKVDQKYLHRVHLAKKVKLKLFKEYKMGMKERRAEEVVLPLTTQKADKARPVTCSDCHGGLPNRGHNFSVADNSCLRCHPKIHNTKMGQKYGCRNCHFQDFIKLYERK